MVKHERDGQTPSYFDAFSLSKWHAGCWATHVKGKAGKMNVYMSHCFGFPPTSQVIPRSSTHSFARLANSIATFDWQPVARREILDAVFELGDTVGSSGAAWKDGVPAEVQATVEEAVDRALNLLAGNSGGGEEATLETSESQGDATVAPVEVQMPDTEPLLVPGRVLHLYRSPNGYDAAEGSGDAFMDVRLSSTLVEDHFANAYKNAVDVMLLRWSL